jgi:hypothetical protein
MFFCEGFELRADLERAVMGSGSIAVGRSPSNAKHIASQYRLRHNHIAYATGYTSVEGRKFTTYSRRYAAMYHQRGGWSGFDCASNTRSSPKMHNIMSFGGSPSSIHAFLMVSIHSQTCHPTTVDTGPSQLQMRITAASLWS